MQSCALATSGVSGAHGDSLECDVNRKGMMDVQLSEHTKWHRGGFLSTLNRSFRLATKSKSASTSPVENITTEQNLDMITTVCRIK